MESIVTFLTGALSEFSDPAIGMLAGLLLAACFFVIQAVNRQRTTLKNFAWLTFERLEKCEEDHIKRDGIQVMAVSLLAECVTVIRTQGEPNPVILSSIEHRVDSVMDSILKIQKDSVDSRERTRELRQENELFGDGGLFDRRKKR